MGAGHGYSYENFMLIDSNVLTGDEARIELLDSIDGEEYDYQIKKIVESELFNYETEDEANEILEDYKTEGVVSTTRDGVEKVYDSLNIEKCKTKVYEDEGQHDIEYESFTEHIGSIMDEIGEKIKSKKDTLHNEWSDSQELKNLFDIEIKNDIFLMDVKVSFIADQYNNGLVTFLKSRDYSNEYTKNIDFEEIFMGEIEEDGYLEYLADSNTSKNPLQNGSDLMDFIKIINEDYSEDLKNAMIDAWEQDYENLSKDVMVEAFNQDEYDNRFEEKYDNDRVFKAQMDFKATEVSEMVIQNIKNQMEQISNQYEEVTSRLFNELILRYDDGTFYYPTSAWTSGRYGSFDEDNEKEEVLFDDNKEIQNEIKSSIEKEQQAHLERVQKTTSTTMKR